MQTKDNELIEVNSSYGAGRNNGDLCARGFFGFHATSHPDRLTKPLIRRNGLLEATTWEEALEYVAEQITRLKVAHGADAFGGLISSRCTNEELFVFQKFMRLVIGTNNLDSSARYGQVNAVQAMRRVQGTHRWTVTFEDIVEADVLLLVGTSITETNPVAGLRVKEAVKKREAKLLTIEAAQPGIDSISNITNLAQLHVGVPTAQFGDALMGLLKAVVDGRHVEQSLQNRSTAYVSALSEALGKLSWTDIEAATGTTRDSFIEMATAIAQGRRVVVLVGQDLLRSAGGYGACLNLLDLLLLTGKLAEPGCGFAPLAEENNDQGAVEMGALAELLPGAKDVAAAGERSPLARAWKAELPSAAGATLNEMIDKARAGELKAMVVVGENPVGSLPASPRCRRGTQKLGVVGLPGALPHRNGRAGACGASGRCTAGEDRHLDQRRGPSADDSSRDRAGGREPAGLGDLVHAVDAAGHLIRVRREQRRAQRGPQPDSRLWIARAGTDSAQGRSRCRRTVRRGGLSPRHRHSLYSGPASTAD